MKRHILLCFSLLFFSGLAMAQYQALDSAGIDSTKIRALREKATSSKVTEAEIRTELGKKGIDLDNLTPSQLPTVENEIKKAIQTIETRKKAEVAGETAMELENKASKEATDDPEAVSLKVSENIKARMAEGMSLDEALAEEFHKRKLDELNPSRYIYGHKVFFDESLQFYRTVNTSTTPSSYTLDVGDKIAINIFGAAQADLIYEVEDDGFIRPGAGKAKIYLKGLPMEKAGELLRNRFRQSYAFTDGQFNINLHTARTITVNIFGEVNQPGSYTISALNTALHALIAAGGPTAAASLRKIKIVSQGKERSIDLYDYLANPVATSILYLREGDLIFLTKSERLVSTIGSGFKITNTMFELLPGENFNALVKFAGGLTSDAYTRHVQHLSREDEEQLIRDYDLKTASAMDLELHNGDAITIETSTVPYRNYVRISGTVRHPGMYEFKKNYRVSDILQLAHLEEEALHDIAYLRRKNIDSTYQMIRLDMASIIEDTASPANLHLQMEDEIIVLNVRSFTDHYQFKISGAVRQADSFSWDPSENIKLYDAIMLARGLQPNATNFGYIVSSPYDDNMKRSYRLVNIAEAMRNPDGAENVTIRARDSIVIPFVEEYKDQFKITVAGAVRKPGEYVYDTTLSLKDVLVMAGGLHLHAASNKIDIFRLVLDENEPSRTLATSIGIDRELNPLNGEKLFELQANDYIVVRSIPEFEPMRVLQIKGEVRYPGPYALSGENERLYDVIMRAGGLSAEALPEAATLLRREGGIGLIVTKIDEVMKSGGRSKYNVVVYAGDVITIPKLIEVVKIDWLGTNAEELYSSRQIDTSRPDSMQQLNIAANFQPKKSAKWYINEYAGGFSREANRRATYVMQPNGQIKRTWHILGLIKFYPKVRQGSEVHLVLTRRAIKRRNKNKTKETNLQEQLKSPEERMMQLQAIISVSTSTLTTALTTIAIIDRLAGN